jgi:hypothetical protein
MRDGFLKVGSVFFIEANFPSCWPSLVQRGPSLSVFGEYISRGGQVVLGEYISRGGELSVFGEYISREG